VGFYRDFEAHVAREVRDLSTDAVRLIVGDIPPLAFAVAARLGTPSVAIANFTWDWIYETHPGLEGDLDWLLPTIRGAYRSATAAWQLPFAGGFEVFPSVSPLSLVARRPSRSRADTRRHLGLPPTGPIALLSFGGYGLPALDFGSIDCLDRWTIVTTDRITSHAAPRPAGVQRIDERQFAGTGFRYEDLVGAVDVVLTKPGYGIVAECVTAGTAMVYTSRGAFREYAVLTAALPRLARARFLPQAALFAGAWRASLDGVLAQPAPPDTIASDGADRAADQLAGFLQDRM
jgi:L-arabinokinase